MLFYFIIGAAILALLLLVTRGLANAKPATVKKAFLLVIAIIAMGILLRFGMPVAAAIVAALPFIHRIINALYTIRHVNNFFKSSSFGQKTSTSKNARHTMSEDEAREILGVNNNASEKEIKDAYQRLMKKNHPDTGGSEYFAARLNQARDILLKKRKG